jgi:hypothetical protein
MDPGTGSADSLLNLRFGVPPAIPMAADKALDDIVHVVETANSLLGDKGVEVADGLADGFRGFRAIPLMGVVPDQGGGTD